MMDPRIALSYYPLPQDYLADLERLAGGPIRNVVVSALRARHAIDALGQLREIHARTIYVPTPGRDWNAFIPLLRLLAHVARAERVLLVDAAGAIRRDDLFSLASAVLGIAWRTMTALAIAGCQFFRLRRLRETPRQVCPLSAECRDVLYIKSNLWAGVTAGGSVSHTAGVIKALTRGGGSVAYVSPGEAPELGGLDGVVVSRVSLSQGFVYPRELNSYRYNAVLERWTRGLPRHRFAFLYHRLSLGSFTAVKVARRLNIPLVVEYNGSEVWINRNWGAPLKLARLAELAEDVVLRHAHLVVTVSEPLRQELIDRGIEAARIVTHANGFDPEVFDPARFTAEDIARLRRDHGIPEDAMVATFVGTFGMWHGAEVLAKALIRLRNEREEWLRRSRLHVVFVGDGVNRSAIEDLLENEGLAGFYTFTGLVPPHRAPVYLAASDILVAPHVPNPDGSEFFGSPTKLFEYMGMARPVLASDLGQIGEVLAGAPRLSEMVDPDGLAGPGQCGLLVVPGNVDELARGLALVAARPLWCRSAGAEGRARALARFTWAHHVGAILDGLNRNVPRASPVAVKPIRVLVNAVHAKSGGGVTYLRNLLPLLADRHHLDIHVVVQRDQEEMARELCGPLPLHLLPTCSRLATVMVQEQVAVPLLARRLGADVVFSPANYGPVWGCHSVILLRNAFEVTALEERLSKRLYWLGVRLLTWTCFRTCRRAIIVSRHAARTFLDVFRLDADSRIDVVHHGVGALFHPPDDGAARIPGRLLAVSDIYVQKNFETLLRAVARLGADHPDIGLVIAGNELDPAYASRLRKLCAKLGIAGRVEFLGGLAPNRVAELYRVADVFVFPSLVETFGNPLVEAMASGLPVVCSDAAAMPEIVGDAALLAAPGDDVAMAAQISRLLGDRDLWDEMAARGLRRATDFSWTRTADLTARILREAAED